MSGAPPTCPVCSGRDAALHAEAEDIEYFTGLGRFRFYRCCGCGVLFIMPMLSDRLGEIYPDTYYSFSGSPENPVQQVKQWLDRRRFRRICADIPGAGPLAALDIGGGTGWLLDLVRRADPRFAMTWVSDIDAQAKARAEQAGHRFALGRFADFAPAQAFDLVIMLNFIEHVADPVGTLRQAAGLLAPGGRILVKTPNHDALDARLFRRLSWGGYHTPRHFVLFDARSMRQACRAAGLRVLDFRYVQGAPFWSVSVLDLLRRAGLVTVSRERPAIRHPLMPALQAAFAAFDAARRPFARLSQMELVLARD